MSMAGLDQPSQSDMKRRPFDSHGVSPDMSDIDDEDSSGDVTQKTVSFKEIESDFSEEIDEDALEDEETANRVIRVYDARYKIPRHTNLAMLEENHYLNKSDSMTRKQKKVCGCICTTKTMCGRLCLGERLLGDVREVICFKKSVHILVSFMMTVCMLFTIGLYIHNMYWIQNNKYFVARARTQISEVIDFENVTTTKVYYFLFRNQTEGASDINRENDYLIVPNVNKTCQGGGYQLERDMKRAISIKENLVSSYMEISEGFIIFLMFCCMLGAVIYVPFCMKEHDIPILLRRAGSNVFFDLLTIRLLIYSYFLVLTGSLPHLTMYYLHDACLHTTD